MQGANAPLHGDRNRHDIAVQGANTPRCTTKWNRNTLGAVYLRCHVRSEHPIAWEHRIKSTLHFLKLFQYIVIQEQPPRWKTIFIQKTLKIILNRPPKSNTTSACKERTPHCTAKYNKVEITFSRLLRHTVIQGATTPLNEDIVKLATSSWKERTPRCTATSTTIKLIFFTLLH